MSINKLGTENLAGILSNKSSNPQEIEEKVENYTLAFTDKDRLVTMNSGANKTITIPADSSVEFLDGTKIDIANIGAGTLTIAGASGVTLSGVPTILAQNQSAQITKLGTDNWIVRGYASFDSPDFTGTVDLPATTNYDGEQLSTTFDSKADADKFNVPATDELALRPDGSTEAVRIDSSGNVGIGTTSPQTQLEIASDGSVSSTTLRLTDTDPTQAAEQTIGAIEFYTKDNSTDGTGVKAFVTAKSTDLTPDASLTFGTNDSSVSADAVERMRIDRYGAVMIGTTTPGSAGAGDLVVNGGVFLGGTAAANELNDYEEGSWTPNIAGNNGTGNFSTRTGRYIKIGKMVYITFVCDFGSSNAGGSTQYLGGLPFAVSTSVPHTAIVGHMGSNGPADKDHQLMTLNVNRGILYLYNGGAQETTALSFASGFAVYQTA